MVDMVDVLSTSLSSVLADFLTAVQGGEEQLAVFNDRLDDLSRRLHAAAAAGSLPESVRQQAVTVWSALADQADNMKEFHESVQEMEPDVDESSSASTSAASLPLFRYFLDNICHPYPDPEEKERLVEQAQSAGWLDFDRKKCEDWLNRKRHQSGYVAIARKYCDEDTESMRTLCYAALFGSPEQKSQVHPRALVDIEEMHELLQAQHYELASEEMSPWVDDLAHGLRDIVDPPSAGDSSSGSLSSDNEDDFADCSDGDSDSDSDASATDVDSDCDDDEDDEQPVNAKVVGSLLTPVIGAKRKLSDLPTFTPPRGRPVFRTLSAASSSSSSSDSALSGSSFRSFSGSSVSSATSWEEEDECERPAKRTRGESSSVEPERTASLANNSTMVDLWVMRVPSPGALSKRKRDDDDLETLARNMKRSRYAALSAAAPSNIPAHHLTSLTDVCTRSWSSVVPFEVLSFSVDSERYTVDCTAIQASAAADEDDEDEDNNLADIVDLCNDPDAPDDATWATVQLHALAQTLTGSRLPMAAELCADTVEVKLEELSPQELSSLGETLATTAESITAEYPLDQSLLLEDDDAFSPPELSDGESSGSSSPDRSPSPPVELESSPERLMADYAMSTRTRKELDTLQHPWFAQMFGQQGLSFFDPNTFRVECNPPPGMMAQESHSDFLAQLDL